MALPFPSQKFFTDLCSSGLPGFQFYLQKEWRSKIKVPSIFSCKLGFYAVSTRVISEPSQVLGEVSRLLFEIKPRNLAIELLAWSLGGVWLQRPCSQRFNRFCCSFNRKNRLYIQALLDNRIISVRNTRKDCFGVRLLRTHIITCPPIHLLKLRNKVHIYKDVIGS